jgi:hypothetical protein
MPAGRSGPNLNRTSTITHWKPGADCRWPSTGTHVGWGNQGVPWGHEAQAKLPLRNHLREPILQGSHVVQLSLQRKSLRHKLPGSGTQGDRAGQAYGVRA